MGVRKRDYKKEKEAFIHKNTSAAFIPFTLLNKNDRVF
jgi:hypothetical protein